MLGTTRALVIGIVVIGGVLLGTAAPALADQPSWLISFSQGDVGVTTGGNSTFCPAGTEVSIFVRVSTDSHCIL